MTLWGQGITLCGFCGRQVYVVVRGDMLTVLMREGVYELDRAVFCSDECEVASKSRLDERVFA